MSVALLIVCHDDIGTVLLHTATTLVGNCPLSCTVVPVELNTDIDNMTASLIDRVNDVDEGEGVLVITDLYGSTPSNLANSLNYNLSVRVVTGISLPMLVRVFNYAHLDLDPLTVKAVSGGRDGVFMCEKLG